MIELGQYVRDEVTGFEGVATARVEYLNGCIQYCVRPRVNKDGEMQEAHYIDDVQLVVVGKGIVIKVEADGGPSPDVPPTNYK